jgi:polyphosphate:AMP phosphotransferase
MGLYQSALLEHRVDKASFQAEEPKLRAQLLEAQLVLVERRDFPVLILVTGMDGAGKAGVIQRLYEWLDPRHLRTNGYGAPDEAERARPWMWRYWRDLPPKGEIGVVFGSWYNDPLYAFAAGAIDEAGFARELDAIAGFERMLAAEGALILKFMLVVSGKEQKKRLKEIAKSPAAGRHVLEEFTTLRRGGRKKMRERNRALVETITRETNQPHAPWIVVASDDPRYRDLSFGRTILEALRGRLDSKPADLPAPAQAQIPNLDGRTVLGTLDMSLALDDRAYKARLAAAQERLAALSVDKAFQDRAVVAVFEGNDAAGKGGSIRRVTAALDPRRFRVHPVAAPTDEEKAQPYLWRFWRHLPGRGHVAIFDRSWYGRVLVERVEGFASPGEWLRAYGEINRFEEEQDRAGIIVAKFWLAISKDEQLRRFQEREQVEFKRFKITDEDWRNREKWDDYVAAVNDMVDHTSTSRAPWTLVEAQDKRWARVKVLETLCDRVEAALRA